MNLMDKGKKKRGRRCLYSFILCVSLLFTACGRESEYLHDDTSKVDESRSEKENQEQFDAFMQEIFIEEAAADTLTLNYTLISPKDYGIEEDKVTLGDYSIDFMKKEALQAENWIARLQTFDYKVLTEEQQLIYDIVADRLLLEKGAADMLLYTEVLGPTTGIQAQLPILLAEYNFRTKQDIDIYLQLLGCVPGYFEQIIDFEKQKADAGLFMSDETAEEIIAQCREFIETDEENYLITVFDEMAEEFPDLSKEEAEEYKEANKKAVKESVIPAYEALIEGLQKLEGSGTNEAGLANLEKGKEYYTYLLKAKTGSAREPKEVENLLEENIKRSQRELSMVLDKAPDAYYTALDVSFPHTDPEESLAYLKEVIKEDFPEIPDVSYKVKYVNPSLEENLSPAFYITPALDDYENNTIYINGASDSSGLFTTLAHEGYPGHMYQNVYFQSVTDSPIREIINITGYSEGWATYVEMYAYHKSEIEENAAAIQQLNNEATLLVYARTDIGVNYDGWSKKDTADYLTGFGFAKEDAEKIFQAMVEEPCSYMPYALGYLEIKLLKEEAEEKLGDAFVLKDFHEFFLRQGACPFVLIKENMQKWMEEQVKGK